MQLHRLLGEMMKLRQQKETKMPGENENEARVHGRSAALKKGEVTLDSVDLDTARFAKMMRDCSLLDKRRLNRAASDLVFTKCKARASASSG